jgi:hypothetical protein
VLAWPASSAARFDERPVRVAFAVFCAITLSYDDEEADVVFHGIPDQLPDLDLVHAVEKGVADA